MKNKKTILLILLFALSLIFWLVTILTKAALTEGNQIVYTKADYHECAEGWYDDEGNVCNIEKYVFSKDDVNKEMIFHYRIPETVSLDKDESLCFFSRGMNFRVYSTDPDGNQHDIDYYDQNAANMSGTDIGLSFHVISLRQADKHNVISLAVTPTEYSAFVLEMCINQASDFITSTVRSRMPMFLGSVFIIFFGFAVIVYTLFAVDTKRERKNTLYAWGVVSLDAGLVLVIQTQMIQILTGRPELWTTLKYALCLLLGYFVALVIDNVVETPHKHFSRAIGYITAVLLMIETVGTMFNILSFYRLWYLSVFIQLFDSVIAVVYVVRENKNRKPDEKIPFSVFSLVSIPIFSLVTGIDLFLYARAGRHMTDWGRLSRGCYVLFILVVIIILLRRSIMINRQVKMMEKYKIESITDALTGLFNRGAYIKKEEELTEKLLKGREDGEDEFACVIISLDLNYLKKVNDNHGHETGDLYIQAVADILRGTVGENGEAYRVGGDEFLAVIYGDDPEAEYKSVVDDMNRRLEEFNKKERRDIPLSLAYGHAFCSSYQDYSIQDYERIADQEMYDCKRRMKE